MLNVLLTLEGVSTFHGGLRPFVHPGNGVGLWLYFLLLPQGAEDTGCGILDAFFSLLPLTLRWLYDLSQVTLPGLLPHLQNEISTSKAASSPQALSPQWL